MLVRFNIYFFSLVNSFVILALVLGRYNIARDKRKFILFIVSGSILTGIAIEILGAVKADKTILFALTYVLLLHLYQRLPIKSCISTVILHYVAAALGEIFTYLLFGVMLGYTPEQTQTSFFLSLGVHSITYLPATGLIAYFAFTKTKRRVYIRPEDHKGKNIYIVFSLILMIIVTANFLFLINAEISTRQRLIYSFVLLSILLPTLAFLVITYNYSIKESENKSLKLYIDTINDLSIDLRRFQHNYRNILQAIVGYVHYKEWDSLAPYVDEIAVSSSQLPGVDGIFSMQNIKNHAVFELILGKTAIAREQSVSIAVETEGLIEDLPIKNTDLCEVIGTFIDNAIEAVSTLNNRLVGIALINDDHHVSITISNCYEDRIHSLPKDRHRGHGLQYVKKILSLYPYILWHTSCSDGIYLQELIIPI